MLHSFVFHVWVVNCYPTVWWLWFYLNVGCEFACHEKLWHTMKARGLQTQNRHDNWLFFTRAGYSRSLWHFERVSTFRNGWRMPQYAIISNTVHITEISAALAATADHSSTKHDTWEYVEYCFWLNAYCTDYRLRTTYLPNRLASCNWGAITKWLQNIKILYVGLVFFREVAGSLSKYNIKMYTMTTWPFRAKLKS